MRLLDEIAHRHNPIADRITDFYFVEGDDDRFKVVETAHPSRIVGGEVVTFRYDYVAFVFRASGWVEVGRFGEEHVETALQAAQVAHRFITEEA